MPLFECITPIFGLVFYNVLRCSTTFDVYYDYILLGNYLIGGGCKFFGFGNVFCWYIYNDTVCLYFFIAWHGICLFCSYSTLMSNGTTFMSNDAC